MKLIIEIDEQYFELLQMAVMNGMGDNAQKIIAQGTPLPKGHGRLKDADAICKDIISALGIRDENYLLEAEKAVYKRIKKAPTIIEADKEQTE